jgi:predicted lipase
VPFKVIKKEPISVDVIALENALENANTVSAPAVAKKTSKKNIVVMDIQDMSTSLSASSAVDENKYENMKVDDLRKIATEKQLTTKENIRKMKKNELIGLLNVNNNNI